MQALGELGGRANAVLSFSVFSRAVWARKFVIADALIRHSVGALPESGIAGAPPVTGFFSTENAKQWFAFSLIVRLFVPDVGQISIDRIWRKSENMMYRAK
jgi:hypothetical protein